MQKRKLFIVIVVLTLAFFIVTIVIYKITTINDETLENNFVNPSSYNQQEQSLTNITNQEFKYSYYLPEGYINSEQTEDIGKLGIEYSELISLDTPRKVDYQISGINIIAFKNSVLEDRTLEQWINSQTESEFTGNKRFVSTFIKSIRQSNIFIIEDTNPILGGSKSPVLFIRTNDFIYEIAQISLSDNYTLFKDIISSFEAGKENIKLSPTEISEINYYFK